MRSDLLIVALWLARCSPSPPPAIHSTPESPPTSPNTPADVEPTATPALDGAAPVAELVDASVDAPPVIACTPADAGSKVDVFIERDKAPPEPGAKWGLVVRIPALGIREVMPIFGPVDCGTRVLKAAERSSTTCTYNESWGGLSVVRKADALTIETQFGSYDGQSGRVLVEPRALPCGSKLVFHKLDYRDPKWSGFGSACSRRCSDRQASCEDPCYENQTDAVGELTDAGSACAARCTQVGTACQARCPP